MASLKEPVLYDVHVHMQTSFLICRYENENLNILLSRLELRLNRSYHVNITLKIFHLNGNVIGFCPQTQKLELILIIYY